MEEYTMNAGDTAFILLCAAFVFIMTPGLAFFYGGMVRRKNVGNTMMQCVFIMGVSVIMWVLVGYALSFGGNHAGIIGGAKWFGFNGVGMKPGPYADTIPNLAFAAFQMMFAMITPALITGSVAGRMKFKALVLFIILWSLIVYYPMAHMVWGEGGFLAEIGSVDFAGGNVVHITSGVSGLVLALTLGKRRGYDQGVYHVHNTPFVFLGAALLWFGWYGFNAGSALAANGLAAHAFMTTSVSAAAGLVSWMLIELFSEEKQINRNISYYAEALHISPVYLNEVIKDITGTSVSKYVQNELMLRAKRMLAHTTLRISEISALLGIDDCAYFTRLFTKTVGINPTCFRKKYLE